MVIYPQLSAEERLGLLEPPRGPVSMVLDTDTYNEIDDQFALVYALLSANLRVEAVYAAPFHNARSSGPADGMEKSYQEILRILDRLGRPHEGLVYRGSEVYLPAADKPVPSPAANDLIEKAMARDGGPLYVVAIGAITNVASAILLEPCIIQRIVVVWLGGQPYYWPTASEFNLRQDVAAVRLVFDSGVPLVHIPCKNVAEHLRTTLPEMHRYVHGQGAIGDYLYETFRSHHDDHYAYSKVIWDISTIAYLNNPAWV
ncbi:MAG: nucleoside hydrolase, partial [Chloroflexi bacterium RBG_13_56_8]